MAVNSDSLSSLKKGECIMPDAALVRTQSFLTHLVDVDNPEAGISPIYSVVASDIELLVRVWMATPKSGNLLAGKDAETALANLVRFKIISDLEQVISSANSVTQAFNLYFGAEIKSFASRVGGETITATTPTKIFDDRREAEIAEHKINTDTATEYIKRLNAVAGTDKLGVVLSIIPVPVEKQTKRATFKPFKFLYVPVEDSKGGKPKVDHSQTYDWQTLAIFDPESSEVKLFDQIYDWLFVECIDPATVKTGLEQTYNTDGVKLAGLLNSLYNLANQQIDLSKKILAIIEKDYAMYQGCMIAGLEVQSIVVDLSNFFGFTVSKSSSSKKPIK